MEERSPGPFAAQPPTGNLASPSPTRSPRGAMAGSPRQLTLPRTPSPHDQEVLQLVKGDPKGDVVILLEGHPAEMIIIAVGLWEHLGDPIKVDDDPLALCRGEPSKPAAPRYPPISTAALRHVRRLAAARRGAADPNPRPWRDKAKA